MTRPYLRLHRIRLRDEPNDEYYTRYQTIADEITQYYDHDPNVFRGKVIYCPCDDHEHSQFVRFFEDNFTRFGLKKLIATCHQKQADYDLFDLTGYHAPYRHGKYYERTRDGVATGDLHGDGDFWDRELDPFWEEADVVITNPPFSLFPAFFNKILYHKNHDAGRRAPLDYIFICGLTGVSYGAVGEEILSGRCMVGFYRSTSIAYSISGGKTQRVASVWLTSIPHPPPPFLELENVPENEFVFDDHHGYLRVKSVAKIPANYDGIMAVPINFLARHNPAQFTLIKNARDGVFINGKQTFRCFLIRKTAQK